MRKMTQAYEKSMVMKIPEVEEDEVQTPMGNEEDELLGDLNPRYFEEIEHLNEAKERIYISDIIFSSKFNFFNGI